MVLNRLQIKLILKKNKKERKENEDKKYFEIYKNDIEKESKKLEKYAKNGEYQVTIVDDIYYDGSTVCDKLNEFINTVNKTDKYPAKLVYTKYYRGNEYICPPFGNVCNITFDWSKNEE